MSQREIQSEPVTASRLSQAQISQWREQVSVKEMYRKVRLCECVCAGVPVCEIGRAHV